MRGVMLANLSRRNKVKLRDTGAKSQERVVSPGSPAVASKGSRAKKM